jgi:hypothetical protein
MHPDTIHPRHFTFRRASMIEYRRADRVRQSSPSAANEAIDREMEERLRAYRSADRDEIDKRLACLDREWDVERVLEANAASLVIAGTVLGASHDRRWLFLPAVVGTFLLQHAVQGWCPPVPVFRALGIRTRKEIEEERYALKLLRGDFSDVAEGDGEVEADAALAAVRR